MIGKDRYYVLKLPKFMIYPLDSVMYTEINGATKAVKVVDIVAAEDPDHVIYILKPLFWRTIYNRFFGL